MGIKPRIEKEDVKRLFEELAIEGHNTRERNSGQIAKTYEFESGDKSFFIQFNQENMSQGTINEIIFSDDFKEKGIPLREMIGHGDYQGYRYIITEKVFGTDFGKLTKEEFQESIEDVMAVLHKISETDIGRFQGYGWLDEEGNGKFESWTSHLMNVYEEEPGCFYGEWFELFDTTFLERDQFDHYFAKMKEQFRFLPDVRKLIHSGYCGGNILVENGKVTAVLDWQDARYGDPLFDLAYMVFWMNEDDAKSSLQEYAKAFGIDMKKGRFDERMKCYKYYIGLDCMRYSAKIDNKGFYDYVMGLLDKV